VTHLLDTNAWAVYLRGKNPHVTARIQSHPPADIGLGAVVLAELYYGAYHSGPAHVAHNLTLIQQLLATFPIVPFDQPAADEYGKLREHLSARGLLIGPNDLLIAATALAHHLILVTHNTAEFSRVPGLKLEDWQVP
jgi:tRNA(fMet)-specific endonuclease VapC